MPVFKPIICETDRLDALARWWETPAGRDLWRQERELVSPWLEACFGYHAVFLGLNASLLAEHEGLRIPHRFTLGPRRADVLARFDGLPLAAESVDLVIIHHVLEYSLDPHHVLREVDRVLLPEGYVLLFGFNPQGPWGWRNMLWPGRNTLWHGHRLGLRRLRDWMSLLGYAVDKEAWVGHGCMICPHASGLPRFEAWLKRLFPRLGMTHVLLARKRISMPAPIRERWSLIPVLSRPSARPVGRPLAHRTVEGDA